VSALENKRLNSCLEATRLGWRFAG